MFVPTEPSSSLQKNIEDANCSLNSRLPPMAQMRTTVFTETPLESTTPIETTTFPTQTATTIEPETVAFSTSTVSTSLLDFFLSTQVLNTRAVDPTLASIHEKMKEEVIQQNQRKRRKTSPSKKKDLSQEDRKNSV